MLRIAGYARRALLVGAGLVLAGCSAADGRGEAGPTLPDSGAHATAALPVVNLRVLVDTATRGLIKNGTGAYVVPGVAALDTFRLAVDSAVAGRVAGADALLDRYGYDVYAIREAVTQDSLVVIRERIPAGGQVARGWGTYVFNPRGQNAADIHVNHPVDDEFSEDIAADLYRSCRCRWFLMAGARRDANAGETADMARQTASVFHTIHDRVAVAGTRALSIHGFRVENHTGNLPAGTRLVMSNGRSTAVSQPVYTAAELTVRTRMNQAGYAAGLFGADTAYKALSATQNPQGRTSNDRLGWGHWLHLEHERVLREDSVAWKQSNAVLRQWIIDHPAP
ncbi:MAG TPA: hypothetical protein VF665_09105 [Longimicrobium sp.]|jgi:hypothetical protein|uniref:hypothetical protein n=1 Tax=Longimicrobium sp. TaxID=2029185 RepID=UPI002EDB0306